VALVLVAAYYDGDAPGVHLTFDRAIDPSGAVVADFTVIDAPESIHFVGSGEPSPQSETEVLIFLTNVGAASGPDVLLTVGAGNGIVAVDDGGTWEGVSGLVLPWP
jgi:hypothetical protein